ncbi:MAG: hypothetical protein RL291_415 [Pseudomonadota bacterium]
MQMIGLKHVRILLGALLLLVATGLPARANIYVIDRNQTYVGFSWTHLGLTKQFGRFTDFDGTISFDPENPEAGAVDVSIRAGSVQTGVEALDRHLRTADFFDAANFRTIRFKSTAVRRTGDRTGEVDGELTIRNETHPVTLTVTWLFTGDHPLQQINPAFSGRRLSAFSATTKIARSRWGLTRALNLVGDEIEIRLEVESLGRPRD